MDKQQQQQALIATNQRHLNLAVETMVLEGNLSDYLDSITSAFYSHFLWMVDADPERNVDHTKVFSLREKHITELHNTLQLTVHLARIYECYDRLNTSRQQADEKEVNHGN